MVGVTYWTGAKRGGAVKQVLKYAIGLLAMVVGIALVLFGIGWSVFSLAYCQLQEASSPSHQGPRTQRPRFLAF